MSQRLPDELNALWRFAYRLTKNQDEAQDLVQQTCLRALEQQSLYQETGALRSWLFRLLHNLWINRVRSSDYKHQQQIRESQTDNDIVDLEHYRNSGGKTFEPESVLFLDEVRNLVQTLPPNQRMVIELICVEGFSYKETAEILDVRIGTVMSRLARARLKMGQLVQSTDNDVPTNRSNLGKTK